jgi:hypothetical protein
MKCYRLLVVAFDRLERPSQITHHRQDGFLIKRQDCNSLAENLMTLIRSQDLRKGLGYQAYINRNIYLESNVVKKWNTLFKKFI